jgi:hypothetical protein
VVRSSRRRVCCIAAKRALRPPVNNRKTQIDDNE